MPVVQDDRRPSSWVSFDGSGHDRDEAYDLMRRLFPLCRSLTGAGVRATFDVLEEHLPLERTEIAERDAGVRLDGPRRVEHPRRLHRDN